MAYKCSKTASQVLSDSGMRYAVKSPDSGAIWIKKERASGGSLPASITFKQWLELQPQSFREQILGQKNLNG